MRILFLSLSLVISISVQGAIFKSGSIAKAKYPQGIVEGNIYYSVYSYSGKKKNPELPIKNCILFHGGGLSRDMVANMLRSKNPATLLNEGYYGPAFLRKLSTEICERLVITLQESTQTSILEMVERSELFLKEVGCKVKNEELPEGQKACAILGHSKAGAVVTAIARRCMEGDQGESKLGEQSCRNIKEVYSASGVVRGVGLSMVILGARELGKVDFIQKTTKLLGFGVKMSSPRDVSLDDNGDEEEGGLDLISDYREGTPSSIDEPSTNPIWFDVSPIAPMERGKPLAAIENTAIQKKGWFEGEYAASATALPFQDRGSKKLSCGTYKPYGYQNLFQTAMLTIVRRLCENYSTLSVDLHSIHDSHEMYQAGRARMKETFQKLYPKENMDEVLKDFTWGSYQLSDGLVESHTALSVCQKSQSSNSLSSVSLGSCLLFDASSKEKPYLNHFANSGYAHEASRHIVSQWLK